MVHQGSWGTPDLGFTEGLNWALSKLSGTPEVRTSQGGSELSNVWGTSNYQNPQSNTSGGQVLGLSSVNNNYISSPNASYNPPGYTAPTTTSGGGGNNSSGGNTNQFRPEDRNITWFVNEFGQPQLIGQAQNDVDRQRNELWNTINSGFDSYKSNLQGMIPWYDQQQGERIKDLGSTYDTVFSGLSQGKQAAQDKLGLSEQEVKRRQANSIQDLQQNLNQVMRATGMQLGAMGAGSTSASQVMAPYAYTKMAGKEFGNISRQAMDQFGQIDQKRVDLETEFASLYNQTELEKQSKINEIKSYYGDKVSQIRELMTQVDPQRAQALAGLQKGLLDQAYQKLNDLQAEDRARKDGIQQWALQRMAQLNDAKIQLQNTGNYDPQAIVRNELSALGYTPTMDNASEFYNPQLIAKRRQELGLR